MTSEPLDPRRSFIVEAPAGSGKTELLIQRYLRLLACVDQPEQIVAITFTRKAAAEMRQRVIETLRAAADGDDAVPDHRKASIELAADVLSHSGKRGWDLKDQPRRMRIMTIDALNAGLAQQMPLLAGGIGSLTVTDDAGPLYTLAARRTTGRLGEPAALGSALRRMLGSADNSMARLEAWLAAMLPQRDRWLRELGTASEGLADNLARNLDRLAEERLQAVRARVAPDQESALFELLSEIGLPGSDRPDGSAGSRILSRWRAAASFLLTVRGEWRRRFTRREGIPASDKALKKRLDTLLVGLQATDGLREALQALIPVPDSEPGDEQRELLNATGTVLPHLLAELRLLFEQRRQVDHTELALAAEQALGAVDRPSELLLAVDRRLEHILVDEFQDTSHLQWRLLELLTAGWEADDGRTLFLVGDPMQSIYRFRDADLSLFLRARRHGLGTVHLESVALTENHRSAREIVDWVNRTFDGIFPATDAGASGMPAYRSASSSRPADVRAGVSLHLFTSAGYAAEIARVVEIIRTEIEGEPTQSIGVLVRSRTHVTGLRRALEQVNLSANAIEIDSLTDTQLGQDLIGLTSALAHPADRLSWLGVLRSPWCGLEWTDLLALAGREPTRLVRDLLCDESALSRLSADGRQRLAWLADRLRRAWSLRAERSFAGWVRDTWRLLDGPATLSGQADADRAEAFFAALDKLSSRGDIDDPARLREQLAATTVGTEIPGESGIEIMTMHRSKGLEFDTVILPALSRIPRGKERNLLSMQDFTLSDGRQICVLCAGIDGNDPAVEYLRRVEQEHDAAERARLLYVAATRARRRLHLLGSIEPDRDQPRSGSLLATLWPGLDPRPETETSEAAEPDKEQFVHRRLRRLGFDSPVPIPDGLAGTPGSDDARRPEFEWVRPASVQVGTLIHRELEKLAYRAEEAGTPVPPGIDLPGYRKVLALLGVEPEDLADAADRVAEALGNVWADPVGRWILQPRPDSWSERRLTLREHDQLEHIRLDRSFIDDGCRWIIDYKTGRHLGSDVEAFLASEVERYREQLMRYAASVAEIEDRPIRVGLYFPLMKRFAECELTDSSGNVTGDPPAR